MVYQMTVKTLTDTVTYTAIGNRDALIDAAFDLFDVCAVSAIAK